MRTVVFDLDGTLADTAEDLLAAANACFVAMGYGSLLTREDHLTAFHGAKAMLRLGFSRSGFGWTETDVNREYPSFLAHYAKGIAVHTKLYPGARDAVIALRAAGFSTTICTNKPEALAETLVHSLGIRDLFDVLIGADTLSTRKPDPAPYIAAVERAGGVVARSMLVGDTETDRKTALAVGVPVALVTFGPEGQSVSRFTPEALLDNFDDLPTLASRLLSV